MGDYASLSELIVNFFTAEDFVGLLSRQAMLPLIVFSLLFGFAVNLTGGGETLVGKFLDNLAEVMLKFVQLVTYYAPIAFFGFFADLVATYGSQIVENYVRALAVYYPLCFLYIFTAWPLFAWFGGGKGAVKTMFAPLPSPPSSLWAPALPWPPSPPIWRPPPTLASPRMSPTWYCLWAPPCTWMAPAFPAC